MALAKRVPGMSPLVSGRKATEKLQLPLGARLMQAGPSSTNSRGIVTSSVSCREVRLVMVKRRLWLSVPVGMGPYSDCAGRI